MFCFVFFYVGLHGGRNAITVNKDALLLFILVYIVLFSFELCSVWGMLRWNLRVRVLAKAPVGTGP